MLKRKAPETLTESRAHTEKQLGQVAQVDRCFRGGEMEKTSGELRWRGSDNVSSRSNIFVPSRVGKSDVPISSFLSYTAILLKFI